jgi:hypothetical protein
MAGERHGRGMGTAWYRELAFMGLLWRFERKDFATKLLEKISW